MNIVNSLKFIRFVVPVLLLLGHPAFANAHAVNSGITGRVYVSPSCPGPQKADQEACTSPLAGAVVQLRKVDGAVVHQATSSDEGGFSFKAPPGAYVIHVEVEGLYPRCPDVEVTLIKSKITQTEVACDSGMR